ncbi:MAG: hypothetical protein GX141_02245 [Armatimonadetes bacterium]|nr:hypothetical protein [Armatimonadota bacterium]
MLDDYKFSVGRFVAYRHTNPQLPRQSYGHLGPDKTLGQVLEVDLCPNPRPHWVYTIQNSRNGETCRVKESNVLFAAEEGNRALRKSVGLKTDDGALTEMIARALSNPARGDLFKSTIRDMILREEREAKAHSEGPQLPINTGDYIRVRGDRRGAVNHLHNHYAKVLSVADADIAGIENPEAKPGQPTIFRTCKKYEIVTSEGAKASIYDAEVKLFYTANSRSTILNWRAATLLAETFGDQPPYKLEFEYLADHVFTRDELRKQTRAELMETLASLLYVKGKMGWRDYQRRNAFFTGTPKSHLVDNILQISRFDSRKNRPMTLREIANSLQQAYKLRRLLKS